MPTFDPNHTRYALTSQGGHLLKNVSFTFWRDGKYYLGFLNQYPDYQTQATTKSELTENLTELLKDIESREVPYIRSCMSPAGSQLKACFGHLRSDRIAGQFAPDRVIQ